MDAGIIAMIKGQLRTAYGRWATELTLAQLAKHNDPARVTLPMGLQSVKQNMATWISVISLPAEKIVHC